MAVAATGTSIVVLLGARPCQWSSTLPGPVQPATVAVSPGPPRSVTGPGRAMPLELLVIQVAVTVLQLPHYSALLSCPSQFSLHYSMM